LPAVLAVTGVVTLIFLVAITALASLNTEARSARERARFLESALTAEATLQYLATTEPFGGQSLNPGGARMLAFGDDGSGVSAAPAVGAVTPVYLDGRPYEIDAQRAGTPAVLVSLRDQAGMINLARLDDDQLLRLGNQIGAPASLSRDLRALYTDYTDDDDLETINGAERSRYEYQGPANRFMRRPSEFLSIVGLRQSIDPARWRNIRDDLVIDHQSVTTNVNTATVPSLEVLFGITEQQAQSAVRARDRSPFLSLADFIAASGANILYDDMQIYTFPAGRIVYTIGDTRSAWRYRARLILTPSSLERPFWVDQSEMTETSGIAMASRDADRFPYTPR
jgi:hypothetical protein